MAISRGPGRQGGAGAGKRGAVGSGTEGVGGASRGPKTRVLTARHRSQASAAWIARQLADPYVMAAKAAGYRARSAFKLIELDEQFGILAGTGRILDLGAAPGGWTQIARIRRPGARVVALDVLDMERLEGVTILKADIRADDTPGLVEAALGGVADLVLSDMAANTVGHRQTDHLCTMGLIEAGLDLAETVLAPGGAFVAKVLAGGADSALVARLKQGFTTVRHAKPAASRKESREWYVVAQGWKGATVSPEPSQG